MEASNPAVSLIISKEAATPLKSPLKFFDRERTVAGPCFNRWLLVIALICNLFVRPVDKRFHFHEQNSQA